MLSKLQNRNASQYIYGRMVCKINIVSKTGFYVVKCSFVYKFDASNCFSEALNRTKGARALRPVFGPHVR